MAESTGKETIYEKAIACIKPNAEWIIENPPSDKDDDYARICLGAISGICNFVEELMKEGE